MQRREFLVRGVGYAFAGLGLEDAEAVLRGYGPFAPESLDKAEALTTDLIVRRHEMRPQTLYSEVQRTLVPLGELAEWPRKIRVSSSNERRRLLRIASELQNLAGWAAWCAGITDLSFSAHEAADELARAIGDGPLRAQALMQLARCHSGLPVRMEVTPRRSSGDGASITILDRAEHLTGTSSPGLLAEIRGRRAEENAAAGRAVAAERDLEHAAEVTARGTREQVQADPWWCHWWNLSSGHSVVWEGFNAKVRILLNEPRAAEEGFERVFRSDLKSPAGKRFNQAGIYLDLAEAAAAQREVDKVVDLLTKAVAEARKGGLTHLTRKAQCIVRYYFEGRDEPRVAEFDDYLRAIMA